MCNTPSIPLARPPPNSRLDRPWCKAASAAARHGLPTKLMKDKPMELILIILLLVVLFGGGFGYYRGGYYRQGGAVGVGGLIRVGPGLLGIRGPGHRPLGGPLL